MTSPTEIPEALKAKARQIHDICRLDTFNFKPLAKDKDEAIALALLQVRNEAIAEERAAVLREVEATAVQIRNRPEHAYSCALLLAEFVRARP